MNALESLQSINRPPQEIDGWNVQLYFLSRSPRVLLGIAAVLLTIAVGIAWFVQKPLLEIIGGSAQQAALKAELAVPSPSIKRVLELLPQVAAFEAAPAPEWIAASQLSQPDKMVAGALWTSLQEGDGFEPSADLLYFAHYAKPLRFANELIGDHFLAQKDAEQAARYFRREAALPDAFSAREKLVNILVEKRDRGALRQLASDPAFVGSFMPQHKLYFAALEQRWRDMVVPLRDLQAHVLQPIPATIAMIAGLVWFLVALQAIQPSGLVTFRVFAPILAVLAGIGSTFPTLLASVWMEEAYGLRMSDDLLGNIAFFMLGVGPREELIKLALFLPFVPILLIRKSRLEMIVVAGCVGLGFAIWENLHYFARYGSAVAFPRFLTANFFHFALTGLNGFALCEFLREPGRKLFPFLGILAGTMFAHGAYDTFATFSEMPVLELACGVVFMLVSLLFFRTLRGLRDGGTDQLCIAGTLVTGLSVLAGAIIIFAAREMGLVPALITLGVTGFTTIMVVYMFYWQLGEGMSTATESANRPYFS